MREVEAEDPDVGEAMIELHVFCYGPNDWRVEPSLGLQGSECSARCTTREAAEAARRLLSGACECRRVFNWTTMAVEEYWR